MNFRSPFPSARPLLVLAGTLGLGAGLPSARAADEVRQLHALDFSAVSEVEVVHLGGRSQKPGNFYGFLTVGKWHALPNADGLELAKVFRAELAADLKTYGSVRPDEEVVHLSSFCFEPGYALRLETDRGRRMLLVCLKCDKVQFYDSGSAFWEHELDANEASRLQVLLGGPER